MIFCVEDDSGIRDLMIYTLHASGFEAEGFPDAGALWEALRHTTPQLIMLDIMLPDESGLAVTKKLREDPRTRQVPIILVTAKTTELDKVRGLDMGADDYITKPFGVMELISRVRALLRRSGEDKGEKSLTIGKILLDGERHAVYVGGVLCELTYKEYELLRLLMQRAGIVTTREEILNHVWGSDFQGESRTLDMHIKTLRQKLGEAGGMIRTVRSVGYFLENDGSV